LLTARDLREQQTADRTRRNMLGRAIGAGVVEGLEVSSVLAGSPEISPVVKVQAGVAINSPGQLLVLAEDRNLTLNEIEDDEAEDAGLFHVCDPQSSTATFVGFGVYVLVMSPASGYSEYAAKIELGDEGVAKGCGRRYALEGVKFRLVELPLQGFPDISAAQSTLDAATTATTRAQALSRLRSIIAQAFLRSAATASHRAKLRDAGATVFAEPGAALDQLMELELLGSCDVPLAVLFWDTESLRFVDNWSARRLARWLLDASTSSLFPASGLERHLQFQAHLAQLLLDVPAPGAAEVQDFFRYLPPAGYFPVPSAGSNAGFSSSRFLEEFVDQSAGTLMAGQFTQLLENSFACEYVDLEDNPYLQQFEIRQNSEDVASGNASQRVRAFISRELNGPTVDDGVVGVLEDAWDAWRVLLRRRDFVPFGGSVNAQQARHSIRAAVRDVMEVANRGAAEAAAFGLDSDGAWSAFDALYGEQNELIDIFLTGIPPHGNLLGRDTFTARLNVLVNGSTTTGEPGLQGALGSRNLHDIVPAQQAINDYVREWQAGGTGPFGFGLPLPSPTGPNLAPGELAERPFIFTNGRSETLRFRMTAEVGAPSGTWGRVTLVDESGGEINNRNVAAGDSLTVTARFTTPNGAVPGETATLTLRAELRSTGEIRSRSVAIPIASESGEPTTSSVAFDAENIQQPGNTVDVAPGTVLTYGFPVTYTTTDSPPASQDFDFIVTFDNSTFDGAWQLAIGDLTPVTPDPANVFTRTITLAPDFEQQINVNIVTSTNPGAVGEFTVEIRSNGVTPEFGDEVEQVFEIVVADV
jgi:hypothetical protein